MAQLSAFMEGFKMALPARKKKLPAKVHSRSPLPIVNEDTAVEYNPAFVNKLLSMEDEMQDIPAMSFSDYRAKLKARRAEKLR